MATKKSKAKRTAPSELDARSPEYAASVHLGDLRRQIMIAKSIVSTTIDALSDADQEHPMYALEAAYGILDTVFERTDPAIFWREAKQQMVAAKALVGEQEASHG